MISILINNIIIFILLYLLIININKKKLIFKYLNKIFYSSTLINIYIYI